MSTSRRTGSYRHKESPPSSQKFVVGLVDPTTASKYVHEVEIGTVPAVSRHRVHVRVSVHKQGAGARHRFRRGRCLLPRREGVAGPSYDLSMLNGLLAISGLLGLMGRAKRSSASLPLSGTPGPLPCITALRDAMPPALPPVAIDMGWKLAGAESGAMAVNFFAMVWLAAVTKKNDNGQSASRTYNLIIIRH